MQMVLPAAPLVLVVGGMGPAASSARVMAEITVSSGSRALSITSMSITTDVSSRPRDSSGVTARDSRSDINASDSCRPAVQPSSDTAPRQSLRRCGLPHPRRGKVYPFAVDL